MKEMFGSASRICLGLMVVMVIILIGLVCYVWLEFGVGTLSTDARWRGSPAKEEVEYLKAKLDLYEKRADDLKNLSAGLLGLSTLYALALGFGSYWNARSSERDAKSLLDQIKAEGQIAALDAKIQLEQTQQTITRTRQETEDLIKQLKEQHPLFANMERSLRKMSDRLMALLPLMDWTDKSYWELKPGDREDILFYEKAVATMIQFLDPLLFQKEGSRIYQGLGNFYGLKYHDEKQQPREKGTSYPEDNLDRSRFYLDRAVDSDEKNFAALNDRGYLATVMDHDNDTSKGFFKKSLEAEPKQQRARYNLALLEHRAGQFKNSEDLLTAALAEGRWQQEGEASRQHLRDIHYNLACSRVKRAETVAQPEGKGQLLKQALEDLQKVFPSDADSYPPLEKSFLDDIKNDGEPGRDLILLAQDSTFGQEISRLKERLQPKSSS